MENIVGIYDRGEAAGAAELPDALVQAFSPVAFEACGYPTRVKSYTELPRYADVMQEGRHDETMDALGGKLLPREEVLVTYIQKAVHDITYKLGNAVTPDTALLRAVMVYRWIKQNYPSGIVHEFGPGSGYVGALLLADGAYLYSSTEVTQAFALWQTILFTYLGTGRDFTIPWWEWIRKAPHRVDVITANHMLNEMHPEALQFVLARSQMMQPAAFVIEEIGSEVLGPCEPTLVALRESKLPVYISRAQQPFTKLGT